VLQTGPGAFASVTQYVNAESKQAIECALDEVSSLLTQGVDLGGADSSEIQELVDEVRTEVGRERPNTSRIKALLTTVGLSLQTAATAKGAYDAVKGALSFFGLSLP